MLKCRRDYRKHQVRQHKLGGGSQPVEQVLVGGLRIHAAEGIPGVGFFYAALPVQIVCCLARICQGLARTLAVLYDMVFAGSESQLTDCPM